jgi:V/A-type H+-transporting ATPase subunit B
VWEAQSGRELRRLVTVIGEAALSPVERGLLGFAARFEGELVGQGPGRRTLDETFDVAWRLLATLPRTELTRIPEAVLDANLPATIATPAAGTAAAEVGASR